MLQRTAFERELEALAVRGEPARQFDRTSPSPADLTVAVPDFTAAERAVVRKPLLSKKASAQAIQWNKARHPARSGVSPSDIRREISRYVDLAVIEQAIVTANANTNAGNKVALGVAPLDAVLVEAVCQFQSKTFSESKQLTGRVNETTLDSLGLVTRTGMQNVDSKNATASERLAEKSSAVATATGGEFTGRNWFTHMVNPSFLGRTFTNGIHLLLARKLRHAEHHLLSQAKYAGLTPVKLGRALGITEVHRGARPTKASHSMHTFGLGVDIGYLGNPYVCGDEDKPNGNARFTATMKRATLLVDGVELTINAGWLDALATRADPSSTRRRSTAEIHGELVKIDTTLRTYFRLATDEPALRAKLAERRQLGTSGVFANAREEVDLEAAALRWQKSIVKDFETTKTYFKGDGAARNPLDGILSLHVDLVVALRDRGCLAWGAVDFGGVSGDIMHFDARIDGAGRIVNQGHAPTTGHPCLTQASLTPTPTRDLEEASTSQPAPRLRGIEYQPPGRTVYVDIDLKIAKLHGLSDPTLALPRTGLFVPDRQLPSGEVDLIIYFHGHKKDRYGRWYNALSASDYWAPTFFSDFPLREQLNETRRSVVLVLPTLGPKSQAGLLVKKDGFDGFVNTVVEALDSHVWKPVHRRPLKGVRHIVLAAHSGGGEVMRAIVKSKGVYSARIKECWGFDNFYGGWPETQDWIAWATGGSGRLFSFYLKGSPKANAERLQKLVNDKPLTNIQTFMTTASSHFDIPRTHWRELIGGAGFDLGRP